MNTFTISIAEKNIRIIAQHGYIKEYCRDYLTEKAKDFEIIVEQSDIDYERKKSESEDKKEGLPVRNFSDEYLETLAVYRKIANDLIEYDTILFHGSVIAVDGFGYLFTAKSGTGKSTHTRLWRKYFGERVTIVNDDKPLIRILENGINVYGTPWDGKHRLSTNISVPLKSLCIIERSNENVIHAISKSESYDMLVQQVHKPNDPKKLIKTLQLIDILADKVNLYKLSCNMDISAAIVAYKGMQA